MIKTIEARQPGSETSGRFRGRPARLLACLIATAGILATAPVAAEDFVSDDWKFQITPYAWALAADGDVTVKGQKSDLDLSFHDIVASGSVLDQIPALFEHGARPEVHLAITHPVLLPSALKRLDRDWIAELVVTDTILVPPAKRHPKLRVVSVGPMLAHAIRGIHRGESIGVLWDPDAPRKLGFSRSGAHELPDRGEV